MSHVIPLTQIYLINQDIIVLCKTDGLRRVWVCRERALIAAISLSGADFCMAGMAKQRASNQRMAIVGNQQLTRRIPSLSSKQGHGIKRQSCRWVSDHTYVDRCLTSAVADIIYRRRWYQRLFSFADHPKTYGKDPGG